VQCPDYYWLSLIRTILPMARVDSAVDGIDVVDA
jgi:hypothetical protein